MSNIEATAPIEIGRALIDPATVQAVGEGVFFGWRCDALASTTIPGFGSIWRGVFWLDGKTKAVSLAMGDGLHGYDAVDFENYPLVGEPTTGPDDPICCHGSFDEAQACALTFFATGHWCTEAGAR